MVANIVAGILVLVSIISLSTSDKEDIIGKYRAGMQELFCKRCKDSEVSGKVDEFKQCITDMKNSDADAFVGVANKFKEGEEEPADCRTEIGTKFDEVVEAIKNDAEAKKNGGECVKKMKDHVQLLMKCYEFKEQ